MKWKWYSVLTVISLIMGMAVTGAMISQPKIQKELFIHQRIESEEWIRKSELNPMQKFFGKMICHVRGINHFKAGRYIVNEGETLWGLIAKLRSGNQEPITIRVGNLESIQDLAVSLGKQLKCDSTEFINYFTSDTLKINSTAHQCLPCNISPNDYEMYWTITPAQFLKKMIDLRNKFWSSEKLAQAQKIGLTPDEVCILASIVKAESGNLNEISTIAGLYMNRLKINMPLQSDPTVLFGKKAARQKRVSFHDLQIESPYNTYKRKGLPPGPICLVENQYLDAVLNFKSHDFLYMCAVPGGVMAHTFSNSYAQHLISANAYRKWLDREKIH